MPPTVPLGTVMVTLKTQLAPADRLPPFKNKNPLPKSDKLDPEPQMSLNGRPVGTRPAVVAFKSWVKEMLVTLSVRRVLVI